MRKDLLLPLEPVTDLTETDLTETDLTETDLTETGLTEPDLTKPDLTKPGLTDYWEPAFPESLVPKRVRLERAGRRWPIKELRLDTPLATIT
ncbi:MAG: hypothetical protein EXQ68_02655 [Acidimicrobiia bacterium]|nr:hypothetical protein [Acidimicrobiia bacterium]